MHIIIGILKNMGIALLSIVCLIAGLYLLLLVFDWWLKLKTGRREQEGLSNLLVTAFKEQQSASHPEAEAGNSPIASENNKEI
jgi:ABC-type uncharacterized transport system fused permease/ATPase subunit